MRKFLPYILVIFLSSIQAKTLKSKLPNGLTLLITPTEIKQLVYITVLIKGGSNVENNPGASNLLMRLLPLGTKQHTKDEIRKILEDNLMDLETQTNINYWQMNIRCPSYTLPQALNLLKEILFYPLLDEYELEKEKKKIITEIDALSTEPLIIGYAHLCQALYGLNHPYGRPVNGTRESVEKISLQEIRSLHLAFFQPQNIIISITGDVEPSKITELCSELFGELPKGESSPISYPFYHPLIHSHSEVLKCDSQFAYVLIGIPLPGINHPDYPILELINALLGKGTSSRLAKALRWRMGISYDFGSLYPSLLGKSLLFVWATVDPERVDEAKEALINEIASLDYLDEKEYEKAKNKLKGDYLLSLSSLKKLSFQLAFYEATGLGYNYIEKFPQIVENITLWDVKRTVRRYLKGNLFLLLITPSS